MPASLERVDDPVLLRGRDARKDTRAFGDPGEGGFVHRLDLVAENDPVAIDANLAADVPSDELVVTREYLHLDPVVAEPGDRLCGALEQVIGERQEACERELALVAGLEPKRPR